MEKIEITIDGRPASGTEGMTILDAARQLGIEIPALCNEQGLKPSGNCRICVVEVEGMNRLVPACHTPIEQGMNISTRSHRVTETRKIIVELMLASHTGPCMADNAAKECSVHNIASDIEVAPPRFLIQNPRSYPVEMMSPYVKRDLSRCILCRNCVRACREIVGHNVYSMAYRGFNSKVVVDCDVPLDKDVCKDCGVCIEYCPTSALMYPDGTKTKGERAVPKTKGPWTGELDPKQPELLTLLIQEQRKSGYVSSDAMQKIADSMDLDVGDVYGVATFYAFLSTTPNGENVIRICKSLPCYMKHAQMVIDSVEEELGIKPGETTSDGKFSFELTNCIGACDKAPAMLVNEQLYGNLTPEKISSILKSYKMEDLPWQSPE
ncbi:MAG: NADH-quinone oxidoreductase subunit NuoE [Desulfobacteraceae bacterium]|nr:NADH-quinone oxidoreductase subunit NuoE [Desulfobacteraceae bacterium]